jgi:DNA processing protein
MCSAVLVIEAEEKSGTLITARMATDYNRDVLALPGSIFSKSSNGTNMLIRMGATPIRHANDLLEALGFEAKEDQQAKTNDADLTKEEKKMLDLLDEPMHKDELIRQSGFPTVEANIILSMMEIKGLVKEEMGEIRKY